MEAVIGGLLAGGAFGAWTARNTVCFNAGVRRAAFGGEWTILRIFAVAIAVQLLLLPVLVIANADLFSNPDALPAIGLFPVAQLIGGLVFGAGMALAGGCIAGILWKSGAGSIATAIAIGGFIAGELLIRGPFDGLLTDLDTAVEGPADQTLYAAVGVDYLPLALLLGAGFLLFLLRRGLVGVKAGVGLGLIGVVTWLLAGWADYGYGLGFVGAAENARSSIIDGGTASFAVFLAVGTVAGAALAIRGPLRLPDRPRATRAAVGGLAMGIGGSIAHGCNIGNGLTGIPLLSIGSILATAMMALGVFVTWRWLLADRPAIRGSERPEPEW
ncbi:MAG: YeeE/YedE family protein [Solirubrobacterales bacterium]